MSPEPKSRGRLRDALVCLLLAAAVLVVYAPVAEFEFLNYDDGSYVVENQDVRQGLSWEGVTWAFTRTHSANWHPLTWLSHMLDCELFGLDAGRHHLVNALLHALNAALLFLALRALTGDFWPAVIAAGLFALHPMRVESVAWVAERKDVLSGTFWMLTLLAYARYVHRPGRGAYALVFVCFALGLMAKPMLVTLPFVLLLLDVWPLRRWSGTASGDTTPGIGLGRLALEKLPLFALSLASSVVTVLAQSAGNAIRSFEVLPLATRLANAAVAYATYAWKSVWPGDMAVFYPHPALVTTGNFSPTSLPVLGAGLVLILLTALLLSQARQRPHLAVGWLWFLGTLLPVIGLFQVGAQWMADRYAYLPLIGLHVAVVWGAAYALAGSRTGRAGFLALGGALFVGYGALARHQVGYWRDNVTLYEHALQVTESNYVAHNNLGIVYQERGDSETAEGHYREVIRIAPNMPDAHSNLGVILMERGETAAAIEHFERALALRPNLVFARLNLGLLHEQRGDLDRALEHYRLAVRERPRMADARFALANALSKSGDREGAIDALRRAVELQPDHARAHGNLGVLLCDAGRIDEGKPHLLTALRLDPALDYAAQRLASALREEGE